VNQRTRIKICGVSREADIEAAVEAGADAIGFVFHPPSPRNVTSERAAALARVLPPYVTPVGLFVNAARVDVKAALAAVPTLVIQFHGDETAVECDAYARPYLRAARMTPELDLLDFARRFGKAQGLLLDAHVEGFGGGGKAFDWSLVPADFAEENRHRLVLSGGLHAGNVVAGIQQLRPWAVDVSSGVESARGVKDAAAIRRFCDAVREADSRIAASIA
jgi:phosphoribosylanthranilate isomerase